MRRVPRLVLVSPLLMFGAVALLAGAACTGSVSGESQGSRGGSDGAGGGSQTPSVKPDDVVDPVAKCDDSEKQALAVPLRRLSIAEYRNTLRDLLPGVELGEVRITADQDTLGFENRARDLFATEQNVSDFQRTATDVATKAMGKMSDLLPCQEENEACAGKFIAAFGKRAFRRPLSDAEQERYHAFAKTQIAEVGFKNTISLLIEGMLQSANFLYRPAFGDSRFEQDGQRRVTGYEMASRLSYFIWGSMPDDALFAAAEKGLSEPKDILAQAERMLGDEKARAQMIDFHRQWLDFDHIGDIWKKEGAKDATLYPDYGAEMVASMREEVDRLAGAVMFDGSRTVQELLSTRAGFVDARLAKVYGVEASGDAFSRVELPADQRAGFLTRGAFLASHAHKFSGSPPLRGVFVMDRLLCIPKQLPDPDADTSEPMSEADNPKTNRQLFEERVRTGGTCRGCHQYIDPMGFVFEHYDAIGGYRTEDNGLPVDASGAVTSSDVDGEVKNAIEFSERLAGSKDVAGCMTGHWFQFAVGRDKDEGREACKLDGLKKALLDAGGDVRALQMAVIKSPDFLNVVAN